MTPLRVLFVTSECAPWLKVGGLADVAAALPVALTQLGIDVRVLLPRIAGMPAGRVVAQPCAHVSLRRLAADGPPLWMLDTPRLQRRTGIYASRDGHNYGDDAECFAELCQVATLIAADTCGLGWRPDIVHCNEWQTALIPLQLMLVRAQAASVLTIHNLAHQGVFPLATGTWLGWPHWAFQPETAEYWQYFSFLKAGLVFADRLTTVSPGYAAQILTPAFGAGLDGVLRGRIDALTGILNGLDNALWDPQRDPLMATHFSASQLERRHGARQALEHELGWNERDAFADVPLAAVVSRLTPQKGTDLVLDALPELLDAGLRLVVLGTGNRALEQRWQSAARQHPGRVAVRIGFDETLAHRVYAGSDLFLMPSRFEPCGLAQMCAMRYGAVPVVNPVGGLADTVADAGTNDRDGGTGFWMPSPDAAGLIIACRRALTMYADANRWRQLVRNAMHRRFDWRDSARHYLDVYRQALQSRPVVPDSTNSTSVRRIRPTQARVPRMG